MSTRTFALSGPINLDAKLGRGSLVVTAVDDLTEAVVALTPREAKTDILDRIAVALDGPTLVVHAPRQGGLSDLIGGWRDKDAVDVEITVPSGTAMKIVTFSAGVTVRGRSGGVDVGTGSGDVTLDEVDGDLRVRSGSAACTAGRVAGSAVVRAGAGSARFGSVGGDVQAGFGSGDIEIGTAHGAVRSRSGSGDARLDAVFGDVDFATGSGRVDLGLPAGVAAKLDVHTGSGSVVSDLPIEDTRTGAGRAITIKARTGSGDVRLFRAAVTV